MRHPKLIEVLGYSRGFSRLTDKNLKLLHMYLYMAMLEANEEIKRRGLSDGREIVLHLAYPE